VLRRRNKTKLMWSSDYPILPFDRTITEGRAIELPEDSRANFLGANALQVFGEPPVG
jgi:predicted TIM-barrel fold metal-dependent hydrolase